MAITSLARISEWNRPKQCREEAVAIQEGACEEEEEETEVETEVGGVVVVACAVVDLLEAVVCEDHAEAEQMGQGCQEAAEAPRNPITVLATTPAVVEVEVLGIAMSLDHAIAEMHMEAATIQHLIAVDRQFAEGIYTQFAPHELKSPPLRLNANACKCLVRMHRAFEAMHNMFINTCPLRSARYSSCFASPNRSHEKKRSSDQSISISMLKR